MDRILLALCAAGAIATLEADERYVYNIRNGNEPPVYVPIMGVVYSRELLNSLEAAALAS